MDNFDLKKYLAESQLLKENADKEIVSHIADTYIQNAKDGDRRYAGFLDLNIRDAVQDVVGILQDPKHPLHNETKEEYEIVQKDKAKGIFENKFDVATTEKIAQAVADAFTADDYLDLKYVVNPRIDAGSFDLDVEAGPNTPGPEWRDKNGFSIANYLGEFAGGSFYIKDGVVYNAASRNAPVANVTPEGEVKMISAADSRAAIDMEDDERNPGMYIDDEEWEREMGRMEESKEEKKSNKMKKSELKEMIRTAFLNETEEKVEEGTWAVLPARIPEFIQAVEDLKDEYHGVVGSDDVFNGLDNAISAAEELLMNTAEVGDMPGFEGTRDALSNLGLEEAEDEEEVTVDDTEEIDVDTDAETVDAGEMEVTANADAGLTGIKKEVQDNLEAALEAAKAIGDQKLVDQIGNSITFFTRTHVVGKGEVAEADVDVEVDSPSADAEVGMKLEESINRMQKLAGLIK